MSDVFNSDLRLIEYRRTYSKIVLKTISAFANFQNGSILIGIDGNGEVVGVPNPEEMCLTIENAIQLTIDPQPDYELYTESIEGHNVIHIKVYRGELTPYTYKEKAYKKSNDYTVVVDKARSNELILMGKNLYFGGLPYKEHPLAFYSLFGRLQHALGIKSYSEDILLTLALKSDRGYNYAAALLSDNNPIESSKIQLIAYEDNTNTRIKERQELNNISVLDQVDQCLSFYKKHVKDHERIPFVAYKEAMTNAIVHRDYLRLANIRVEVFSDRIEVTSPGTLPIGISTDAYEEGQVSVLRNRILADVFMRLGIMERQGKGVKRIRAHYRRHRMIPQFRVHENSVSVVLPSIMPAEKGPVMVEEAQLQYVLSANEEVVMDLLASNRAYGRTEIEKLLNLKRTQTGDILKGLREKGLVVKIGTGRSVKYKQR